MKVLIIWLLIIFVIYSKTKEKEQKKNRQSPQKQSHQQSYQAQANANSYAGEMRSEMLRKQQELKNRLQQKYGSMAAGTPAKPMRQAQPKPMQQGQAKSMQQVRPDDIASRAAANVKAYVVDELERKQSAEVKKESALQAIDRAEDAIGTNTSQLMRQVNDLMIMGYQAELSFERDFIGEGIDMLSQYELLKN